MKILKFGGSSVANAERISNVADIIKSYVDKGEKFGVVVSALGGVTDFLIGMSRAAEGGDPSYKETLDAYITRHFEVVEALISKNRQDVIKFELQDAHNELANILKGISLIRELSKRTLDNILSHGERSSAFIISEVLKERLVRASYVDARKLVKTDSHYGTARVDVDITYANIKTHFAKNDTVSIITGFIASNAEGVTTTLGRGGSDYTASFFASALDAEEIEIWTDVDGVLTADPRKVKQAFSVDTMSYEEAMEMSHFGAKVIYPPTIMPALEKNIPIRIKNTFNPAFKGTLISDKPEDTGHIIKGIASISDLSVLTLEGGGLFGVEGSNLTARLFILLAKEEISVILITQGSSEHSLCFAVAPADANRAIIAIGKEFVFELRAGYLRPVKKEDNLSVISVIGENMKSRPGISARFFQALGRNGINISLIAQGSSERNISVVIPKEDEGKALNAVHEAFFLSDTFSLNLFLVGVGLIGGTLIKQIQQHARYLKEKQFIEVNVVALSNTKTMVFDEAGIDLENWVDSLNRSDQPADLEVFIQKMIDLNMANSIFVDNTANSEIIDFYPEILNNSISISTPNKVATSNTYASYQQLKKVADRRGVYFQYETNVGAGLPVLTTIADLVNSGDRILKIEGILSGSLSYIFNSFEEGVSFSEVVRQAGEKGYTEPDPRIDLSGKDVARKLLILAREAGLPMEAEQISVENILPKACQEAPTVPAFMEELKKADDHFESLRAKAAAEGKVLRFIATLEGEKAFISLQALDTSNPFYNLSGSDNMIVFTTERYKERPLVIKGPGAGAEVTAAGIFAEIVRIGNLLSPILRLPE